MMTRFLLPAVGVAFLTLAACEPAEPVAPEQIIQVCQAQHLNDLVGQDQSALDALDPQIKSSLRILQVDGMVDASYNPDRTNVTIDTDGKIKSIRCF